MKTLYKVCKYFDDYYENTVAVFNNKKEADEKAIELKKPYHAYIDYIVREEEARDE